MLLEAKTSNFLDYVSTHLKNNIFDINKSDQLLHKLLLEACLNAAVHLKMYKAPGIDELMYESIKYLPLSVKTVFSHSLSILPLLGHRLCNGR